MSAPQKAKSGEGWCADCVHCCQIGNVSLFLLRQSGRDDATNNYCQSERRFIEVDEHCKEWMKND